MSASLLERLADVMRSSGELKVRAVAAATIWTLAEVSATLARLPIATVVPALVDAALAEHGYTAEGSRVPEHLKSVTQRQLEAAEEERCEQTKANMKM